MKREELSYTTSTKDQDNALYAISLIGQIETNKDGKKSISFIHDTEEVKVDGEVAIESQKYITISLAQQRAKKNVFTGPTRPVTLNIFERESELFNFILQFIKDEEGNEKSSDEMGVPIYGDEIVVVQLKDSGESVFLAGKLYTVPTEPYFMVQWIGGQPMRVKSTKHNLNGGYTQEDAILDKFQLFVLEGQSEEQVLWEEYQRRVLPFLVQANVQDNGKNNTTILEETRIEL